MSLTVVSGAAGFIGSSIVKGLLDEGVPSANILAVDTSLDLFAQRECSRNFEKQGIRLFEFRAFLEDLSAGRILPHRIFHMGACSSTDETREDFLDDVNFGYSRDLWDLSVKNSITFVYASSAATYGSGEWGFSDESALIARLRPLNLYGWSKQKFDCYALAQSGAGFVPPQWAGLKFFNVYGAGESHKGGQGSVAFHAFNQIKSTGRLKLFKSHREGIADGEQKRDFVFIDDCVKVALAFGAIEKESPLSGIYNVGSGTAKSFLELAQAVFNAMGLPVGVDFIDMPEKFREHYQYYTCADLKRLRESGYVLPMTDLNVGIGKYIQLLLMNKE